MMARTVNQRLNSIRGSTLSTRSLIHIPVLVLLAGAVANCAAPDNALDLWYRQPARNWNQALPVGNGRLAAMVFGDAAREHLQLNEDSIWSGTKRDRSNPEASKTFPEVRRLITGSPGASVGDDGPDHK